MKYYIGYLVRGELEENYHRLVEEVCEVFKLEKRSKKERIPHITIKSPFEIESLSDVKKALEKFAGEPFNGGFFYVNAFGHFDERVVYFNVDLGEQARINISNLLQIIDRFPNDFYDQNRKFHITLFKGEELEGRYEDIWGYLKKFNPNFKIPFDNITLFRKDESETNIERIFNLT